MSVPEPGSGTPIEIASVSEWNQALRHAHSQSLTVIVDFHAQWCGPCKVIAPTYSHLASQYPFTYFLRVDVDGPGTRAIAAKYAISAMPTFIVIKKKTPDAEKGEQVDLLKGADTQGLYRLVSTHASHAYAPSLVLASTEAEKAKNEGNEAFKQKDYKRAAELYSHAIDLSPDSAVLYANRAQAYLKQLLVPGMDVKERNKLRPKALQDAQKAMALEERWGKAWIRLAEALMEAFGEESLIDVDPAKREEGKRAGLAAIQDALKNAVDLSEGKLKTEAQKMLDGVKKDIAALSA